MCMIDDGDGYSTNLREERRRARVEHRCCECRRTISPGETYIADTVVCDGELSTYKTCAHCDVVRGWLMRECQGFAYQYVKEDIIEHAREGGYGRDVVRMAAGMRARWSRRDGRMWPVPDIHDAMTGENQ